MARFNTTKPSVNTPSTKNLAGGSAFKANPKLAYASVIMTGLCQDTYYKTGDQSIDMIVSLTEEMIKIDPRFVAKAAVFTRLKNGLRSVSHVIAGEVANSVKGEDWTRDFFDNVVFRVDDVTEILSYYMSKHGDKLPNSLKDGLGRALSRFDEYQLAKYRGECKRVNIYDAVNLCHPKSTPALSSLMKGTLKPAETWEVKLTDAGKAEDKVKAKAEAWGDLISSGKLGYFAALRNLRNIAVQAQDALPKVLDFIQDEKEVKKSKILPFQFQTAMGAIRDSHADTTAVKKALNKAMEASVSSVPVFAGKTLIALDCSGSMVGLPIRNGSLMAAVLLKSQKDSDLMLFSDNAFYLHLNPDDSLSTIVGQIMANVKSAGTNFHSIFEVGSRSKYDRIIILSDMQAWMGSNTCDGIPLPEKRTADSLNKYKKNTGANPFIYSFNLNAVDGTIQFPESKVFCLAGFSDAVLGVMQNLESDPQALVHEIESVMSFL